MFKCVTPSVLLEATVILTVVAGVFTLACSDSQPRAVEEILPAPLLGTEGKFERDAALAPLPQSLPLDERRVALRPRLFEDPKFSADGLVACETCHARSHGGANGQARTQLPGREPVQINVPSVFNLAFNSRFS